MNLRVTEVKKTIFKSYFFVGICRGCNLKRKNILTLTENLDVLRVNFNETCCNLLVDCFFVTLNNSTAESYCTFLVDILKEFIVVNNNLKHTVLITDIEEHYTAVVTDIFNPARNSDLLSDIFFS